MLSQIDKYSQHIPVVPINTASISHVLLSILPISLGRFSHCTQISLTKAGQFAQSYTARRCGRQTRPGVDKVLTVSSVLPKRFQPRPPALSLRILVLVSFPTSFKPSPCSKAGSVTLGRKKGRKKLRRKQISGIVADGERGPGVTAHIQSLVIEATSDFTCCLYALAEFVNPCHALYLGDTHL